MKIKNWERFLGFHPNHLIILRRGKRPVSAICEARHPRTRYHFNYVKIASDSENYQFYEIVIAEYNTSKKKESLTNSGSILGILLA